MQFPALSLKFFLKKIYFFLFIISLGVWIVLFHSIDNQYRVRTITVIGKSDAESVIGTTALLNKNIWFIDEIKAREVINKINPFYEITKIQKEYPSTLSISVRRLYPSAYLDVGNGFLLLSKEGNILQKDRILSRDSIPIITYYQDIPYSGYHAGDIIDKKDIRDVLYYIEVVERAKEKVIRIDIAGYHMLGLYTDDHEYLFSSEKERELQLYQFEEAIKQFQIQGITYSRIDFRFDKPVVKF